MSEWDELLKLKSKPQKEKPRPVITKRIKKPRVSMKKGKVPSKGKVRSIQKLKREKQVQVQLKGLLAALDMAELTKHQRRALKVLQTSKPDWKNRQKDTLYYQKEVTVAGLELILSLLMQNKVKIDY
ncbi:MAG: hypothetical protein ACTSQI_04980 [Candidatus Helarchaeota archaeon]